MATNGSDNNPGTAEKPFATLARARDAIRKIDKCSLGRDITVLIRGGIYQLAAPLVFGPEDSGTIAYSITYAAYPGEKPVISGGQPITGWRKLMMPATHRFSTR